VALTKVTSVSLLAIVSTASNVATVGSAVDVSTYYAADVKIRMGRATGSAFTAAPIIRVEKCYVTSPTANDWISAAEFQPAVGASIASQAVSGTVSSGATTFGVAAATNFAAGDYLFLHNTTLANSEWVRLQSIASTTITLQEALVNAQTGATARDQAEQYNCQLDLTGVQKLRIVVDGAGSGQACIVSAEMGAVTAL
jgi:hypothetical protein